MIVMTNCQNLGHIYEFMTPGRPAMAILDR